jgi:hypothetical protein
MESEADRLASIRALGGQCVKTELGTAPAIFDNGYVSTRSDLGFEQADVAPQLTITTEDAARLGLSQGTPLQVLEEGRSPMNFTVRLPQPDGTGVSVIILDVAA